MDAFSLTDIVPNLSLLDLEQGPSRQDAMDASYDLGLLGGRNLGMARFKGSPPWERHVRDELLIVADGEVVLTLATAEGERRVTLRRGDLFVVPGKTWHRSSAAEEVTLLFATPRDDNEHSHEEAAPSI